MNQIDSESRHPIGRSSDEILRVVGLEALQEPTSVMFLGNGIDSLSGRKEVISVPAEMEYFFDANRLVAEDKRPDMVIAVDHPYLDYIFSNIDNPDFLEAAVHAAKREIRVSSEEIRDLDFHDDPAGVDDYILEIDRFLDSRDLPGRTIEFRDSGGEIFLRIAHPQDSERV